MSDSYDDEDYMNEEEDLEESQEMEYDDEDGMDYDGAGVDDEEGDFQVVPEKDKVKSYEVESKSLTIDDVRKDMRSNVEYVVSIFGLEPDVARMLLREFSWNRERMTEQYMDNASKVLIKAGIEQAVASPVSPTRSTATAQLARDASTTRKLTRKPTLPIPAQSGIWKEKYAMKENA
ncbi:hypothetical protein FRC15_008862 [Serendipita sp. 397]|nr:hypothetical protein FRC15_008862 [Serendipita sp. 397]KAG8801254.1 hypothetical protein FRC16_000974 [Serendipita sp. 398]